MRRECFRFGISGWGRCSCDGELGVEDFEGGSRLVGYVPKSCQRNGINMFRISEYNCASFFILI